MYERVLANFRAFHARGGGVKRSFARKMWDKLSPHPNNSAKASVMIPLFQHTDGEPHVILTKRSSKLKSHRAEVALPGGKRDPGDTDDINTAIREAHEEIGLPSRNVEYLCSLEQTISVKLLCVTPVVCVVKDWSMSDVVANPDEVDAVFHVPLSMFLSDTSNHSFKDTWWKGFPIRIHYFDHQPEGFEDVFRIWGLSARILIDAASIGFGKTPEFVAHNNNTMTAETAVHQEEERDVHSEDDDVGAKKKDRAAISKL